MGLCALTALTSCSYRVADFTYISTKNVDMNHKAGYSTAVNQRVIGKDMRHLIIVFPTGDCNYKEAADKAIEQQGSTCVGLANAKIEYGWWYIPYIYGREWVTVEGDPVYKK